MGGTCLEKMTVFVSVFWVDLNLVKSINYFIRIYSNTVGTYSGGGKEMWV